MLFSEVMKTKSLFVHLKWLAFISCTTKLCLELFNMHYNVSQCQNPKNV